MQPTHMWRNAHVAKCVPNKPPKQIVVLPSGPDPKMQGENYIFFHWFFSSFTFKYKNSLFCAENVKFVGRICFKIQIQKLKQQ